MTSEQLLLMRNCKGNVAFFVSHFCHIYNATQRAWLRFDLWPAQEGLLDDLNRHRLTLILKARQLGLSWLCLAYALWLMVFHPAAAVLIFSQREDEAIELLARLKGMYERLPPWMKAPYIVAQNKHDFELSNGSSAKCFPTTAGRSYTGSLVFVDEADFIPDLQTLLNAVKPAIDAGGKMFLVSTTDKAQPESTFKLAYKAAKQHKTEWHPIFLPWTARPDRTSSWYEAIRADIYARTGALDDLFQEYPATDSEALAPNSLDKRISVIWLEACFAEMEPLLGVGSAPAIPQLQLYRPPDPERGYVLGADPAEGNPTSDDSALCVVDALSGEECAVLAGKFEPATFGSHLAALSRYYNAAAALIERNNHGHAVLQWVQENAPHVRLLFGHDDKPGWMSSKLGKTLLYDACADAFRVHSGAAEGHVNPATATKLLHDATTYQQLARIEGSTLRAPDDQADDRADAFALATMACIQASLGIVHLRQGKVKGRNGPPMIRKGRINA